MTSAWPVIVLGGSGYVAGEMLRLIESHPNLRLGAAVSTSLAGEPIGATFSHLANALPSQRFTSIDDADDRLGESPHWVLLSAAPHGASAPLVQRLLESAKAAGSRLTVVDASADFRFNDAAEFEGIYGLAHPTPDLLPEFSCAVPEQIENVETPHAAHPGCFATTMLLGIVPLMASGICEPNAYVSAVTGSTGAGRTPRDTTHHPVRQSNLFAYQVLKHRHSPEVTALAKAASGSDLELHFVPHSGPFARGIHATIFVRMKHNTTKTEIENTLREYYAGSALVNVATSPPRMKDIVGSNFAVLSADVDGDTIVVCSVLDNLLKGAAGGSLQWVNRLLGLAHDTGLKQAAAGWI